MNSIKDYDESVGIINNAFTTTEPRFVEQNKGCKKGRINSTEQIQNDLESPKNRAQDTLDTHNYLPLKKSGPVLSGAQLLHSSLGKSHYKEEFIITIEKETRPVIWTQILGAVFCATVHLSCGVSFGYTGVTLPGMMNSEIGDLTLTNYEASIFSSVVTIGAAIGSLTSSFVMVWFGQRITLMIVLPFGLASWLILGFGNSFLVLLIARLLQGVVVGITIPCAANYVVEFAHVSLRGRLSGSIFLSLQLGFLFVYLIGSTSMNWRNVGFVCGLTSFAIPFVGMLFLPHSPRWLVSRGRIEEANKALIFFRGSDYNVAPEMNDIIELASRTRGNTTVGKQFQMLKEVSILYRFVILLILLFASNFSGDIAMTVYSVTIFESANVSINPYLSTIITAVTRITGVSIYMIVADKLGRRPLFMIPLFVSGMCMIVFGFFFYAKLMLGDVSVVFWLPLTSLVFFTMFICMGYPVLMMYRSELLPTSVRAVGAGLLSFAFFGSSFCASASYPYLVESIGYHWTFWIYGATSLFMVLVASITIPETGGKTLEEIDDIFDKKLRDSTQKLTSSLDSKTAASLLHLGVA